MFVGRSNQANVSFFLFGQSVFIFEQRETHVGGEYRWLRRKERVNVPRNGARSNGRSETREISTRTNFFTLLRHG